MKKRALFLEERRYKSERDYSFALYDLRNNLTFYFGYYKGAAEKVESVLYLKTPDEISKKEMKIIFEYKRTYDYNKGGHGYELEGVLDVPLNGIVYFSCSNNELKNKPSVGCMLRKLARVVTEEIIYKSLAK